MSESKPLKKKTKRVTLQREHIVSTALALIEKDGMEEFSLRKLAQCLNCEAMSLYHHFPSKAHLLDALVDSVLSEMTFAPETAGTLERLRYVAHAYRAMALRHPRFFQFMALHRTNTETGIRFLHSLLDIFFSAGLDTETTARLFRAFGYFMAGAALDETSGYAKGPSAVTPVAEDVIAGEFPLLAQVSPYFKAEHHAATFEFGLEIFLVWFADCKAKKSELS